ncbi:DMT family transporter [Pigmentibacter sp. JX0631]|uniref:DMT family transporter n=1 Tax=Pigmentibacter sp. JX0631 TaxID=2976982 RepID=UPI002468607D|nr:DMT family transporter [Pigmentibacter sp. JX0631]WGL59978.1 DMT family transporter [Pigmentibacter sp. JX0631]
MKKNNNYLIGVLEIGIANSFVGVNIILNKFLIEKAPLMLLLELRYIFGVLILLFMAIVMKKFKFYLEDNKFNSYDWFIYLLMALSGGVFFNFIYMYGLNKTTATSVGIIGSSIPTIIVIFSYLFLRQPLKRIHVLSVCLVVLGIMILNLTRIPGQLANDKIVEHTSQQMILGNFIVFLAMVPEALFTIFAKMIKIKVCPIVSGLLINLLNGLFCLPFALYSARDINFLQIDSNIWLLSFFIGLFSGALFYTFYNRGIAKIDSNTAALMTGVIPISSAILAIIFLNEPFHLTTFLGMLCVLVSIYVGVRYADQSKVLLHRVKEK